MAGNITEEFRKSNDNPIVLGFKENDVLINPAWTELTLQIGTVSITRTAAQNGTGGITFSGGQLTIVPAELTEDLSALQDGDFLRGFFTVKTATQANGVLYGGPDTDNQLHFRIRA